MLFRPERQRRVSGMAGGVLRSAQNDIACDEFAMKCDVALSVSDGPLA